MEKKAKAGMFFKDIAVRFRGIAKWLVMGVLVGLTVGFISSVFALCLRYVTSLRSDYPWIVYLLPVAGVGIVGFYKLLKNENDRGTNLVFSSITDEQEVPIKMAPSVFVGTVLTHLCGGSAGREGAALQLGGSIGNQLGRWFRFGKADRCVMIMCGMSAAFSALFGTPMAAAVFAIEVAAVGVMYYSALLPCIVSSLVAELVASRFCLEAEKYRIANIPSADAGLIVKCAVIAVICGIVSIGFCMLLRYMKKWEQSLIRNPFLRAAAAAVVFIGITFLLQTDDYYGAGTELIARAIEQGETVPYAFLAKMFLTALVLGAGFKGGEIVPSLCIGATLGCLLGRLFGMSASLAAAFGMTAVFCGVTNCPISAMLISFELFGFEAVPYIMLSTGISYVVSGYISLYSDQVFLYDKYKPPLFQKRLRKADEQFEEKKK